jgi:hypothetical protein
MRCARDLISMVTVNKKTDEKKNSQCQSKVPKGDLAKDILQVGTQLK